MPRTTRKASMTGHRVASAANSNGASAVNRVGRVGSGVTPRSLPDVKRPDSPARPQDSAPSPPLTRGPPDLSGVRSRDHHAGDPGLPHWGGAPGHTDG